MYHHTKFGYKKLNGSENAVQTNLNYILNKILKSAVTLTLNTDHISTSKHCPCRKAQFMFGIVFHFSNTHNTGTPHK